MEFDFSPTEMGWTLDTSTSLIDLLNDFETNARAEGAPVDQLATGIDADATLKAHGIGDAMCHPEIVDWFGWHNGYSDSRPQAASALPQMIACSAASSGEWGYLAPPNQSWMLITEESWGPTVDLSSPPGGTLRVAFSSDDFEPTRLAERGRMVESLRTVVAWWLIGIGAGGYTWTGTAWSVHVDRLHASQRAAHFF